MFEDERKGQLDEEALKKAREEGKVIGLVQGSWDQFHIGHQRYIKKAKEKCDYLIVGVDSDEKIRKRKGPNRPLIPEDERYEMIKELGVGHVGKYEQGKSVADDIVIKSATEKKWGLIKEVKPDVLIAIPENYSMEDVDKLVNECGVGSVAFFGRQAETSTSNKLRQKLIANMADKVPEYSEKLDKAVTDTIERLKLNELTEEPYPEMKKHLSESTDWVTPVVAAAFVNSKWYFGANQCDHTIPKKDLNERTELFYSTTTHAEINLLKRIGDIGETDTVYVSLFPCDKCMKTLINKGIKKVYYLDDHLDKNWSKRSHALAEEKGIETIKVGEPIVEEIDERDYSGYKFIYPPNARKQQQLDIMMDREGKNEDPLDPFIIDQEILFQTEYWYVSENRFPYDGVERQFLVTARKGIYDQKDMSKEMFEEIQTIWRRLIVVYNLDGGALCFRYGDPAKSGASLKRLHFHIIMPKPENKAKFTIGGSKKLNKNLVLKEIPKTEK
ncbi:MAG: adenylyltransferase/cytidyltransferase family protein [Bacilli bacterium]|nr:adenylyltransferase/cytidyltransferase family protein [Bacilli bacterium]